MIRVLVALADQPRLERLHERFRAGFADFQLEAVGGALYALTSLERQKADLIVSGASLDDMDGRDLLELVRDDDTLREIPFILLDSATPGDSYSAPYDDHGSGANHVVLGSGASSAEVLCAAFALLLASGRLVEKTPPRVHKPREVKASGTFEALTLFDIITSLNRGRRSGQLLVLVGGVEATLHLRGGHLVHASLGDAVGEEAVQALFACVDRDPHAEFIFVSSALAGKGPATVHTPVDQLLFQVAVALDEQKRIPV